MKRNLRFITPALFAGAGALIFTASQPYAQEAESERQSEQQQSQSYQLEQSSEQKVEVQSGAEISEPAGAERKSSTTIRSSQQSGSFGTLQKGSDLMGMEVRDSQNEKLGDIKDVMIDLQSGRVPFVVLSSGGIAGIGDRLIAVPPSSLQFGANQNQVTMNMDRERLRSAPTIERTEWREMANPDFGSRVYRYYGQEPYWQSGSYQSGQTFEQRSEYQTEYNEPSGAEMHVYEPSGADTTYYQSETYHSPYVTQRGHTFLGDNNTLDDINKGSNTRGGAEDLQDFDEKANASKDVISTYGTHSAQFHARRGEYWAEPAGAERTTVRESQQRTDKHHMKGAAHMQGGKFHRGSELLGMNVMDSQNKNLGEIKDVVVDLHSGRIAYIVFDPVSGIGVGDQWVAVPPSKFSFSGRDQIMLNADRNMLNNAPAFDRADWNRASNQAYVTEIYQHYGVQPYWSASGSIREPAGVERQDQQFHQERQEYQFEQRDQSQGSLQDDSSTESSSSGLQSDSSIQSDVSEPAGAPRDSSSQLDQSQQQSESQSESISEPSGAQPNSELDLELQKESPERGEIEEPSGASIESSSVESSDSSLSTQSSDTSSAQSSESRVSSSSESEQSSSPSAGVSVTESAGTESQQSAQSSSEESSLQSESEVSEPAGAQPSSQPSPLLQDSSVQSSSEQSQINEPSGAASSSALVEQVRTQLKSDSSAGAQNVQVSSEGGKIVLKGSVESETQKEEIGEKVHQLIIDNQLEVKSSAGQEGQEQSQPSQP